MLVMKFVIRWFLEIRVTYTCVETFCDTVIVTFFFFFLLWFSNANFRSANKCLVAVQGSKWVDMNHSLRVKIHVLHLQHGEMPTCDWSFMCQNAELQKCYGNHRTLTHSTCYMARFYWIFKNKDNQKSCASWLWQHTHFFINVILN